MAELMPSPLGLIVAHRDDGPSDPFADAELAAYFSDYIVTLRPATAESVLRQLEGLEGSRLELSGYEPPILVTRGLLENIRKLLAERVS